MTFSNFSTLEANFYLKSPAFEECSRIPEKYTCYGKSISPPLSWGDAPSNTKSFALIVDDPDAPGWTRIHWVVYNIPPDVFLSEEGKSPQGSTEGVNDKGDLGYRGPCPPEGSHRYFFKLYALKDVLKLPQGATKEQVEKVMESLVIEKTELIGIYGRE
jgi:Raf kinase inhibitor-like YbhB/YbcL family protein